MEDVKIKRRKWTEEEKHDILKECQSRCCCCGIKLNMKTLTMEHVVPISKGGENVRDNLIVLCKKCNQAKANKFVWPKGYYMALKDGAKMTAISKYVEKWVESNITANNLKEYPLVTDFVSLYLQVNNVTFDTYIPSCLFDIIEVDQIESRNILKELGLTEKDVIKTVPKPDKLFSLVVAKGRTSDRILALYTIQYLNKEDNFMMMSEVYSSSSKAGYLIPMGIINSVADVWFKYGVRGFVVRAKDDKITKLVKDFFLDGDVNLHTNGGFNCGSEAVDYKGKDKWFNQEGHFVFWIKSNARQVLESITGKDVIS